MMKLTPNPTAKLTGMLMLASACIFNPSYAEELASPAEFNDSNELILPLDYREWVQVGANVSPNELNNGKAPFNEMRTIYMDRGAFQHWKKTGEFRTGTLLLKEVMGVERYKGLTGSGYAAGEVVAVAGMLKDPVKFADEPGNWGFFRYAKLENSDLFQKTSKQLPTDKCSGCHTSGAQDDMVFTQHYPVLTDSKGTGRVAVPVE
ncbi:cytochrome P460 family protein [Motiliproteus coralliicola]|nr:cytochrome P460 family protein [Motiliproteus coralliicola]